MADKKVMETEDRDERMRANLDNQSSEAPEQQVGPGADPKSEDDRKDERLASARRYLANLPILRQTHDDREVITELTEHLRAVLSMLLPPEWHAEHADNDRMAAEDRQVGHAERVARAKTLTVTQQTPTITAVEQGELDRVAGERKRNGEPPLSMAEEFDVIADYRRNSPDADVRLKQEQMDKLRDDPNAQLVEGGRVGKSRERVSGGTGNPLNPIPGAPAPREAVGQPAVDPTGKPIREGVTA